MEEKSTDTQKPPYTYSAMIAMTIQMSKDKALSYTDLMYTAFPQLQKHFPTTSWFTVCRSNWMSGVNNALKRQPYFVKSEEGLWSVDLSRIHDPDFFLRTKHADTYASYAYNIYDQLSVPKVEHPLFNRLFFHEPSTDSTHPQQPRKRPAEAPLEGMPNKKLRLSTKNGEVTFTEDSFAALFQTPENSPHVNTQPRVKSATQPARCNTHLGNTLRAAEVRPTYRQNNVPTTTAIEKKPIHYIKSNPLADDPNNLSTATSALRPESRTDRQSNIPTAPVKKPMHIGSEPQASIPNISSTTTSALRPERCYHPRPTDRQINIQTSTATEKNPMHTKSQPRANVPKGESSARPEGCYSPLGDSLRAAEMRSTDRQNEIPTVKKPLLMKSTTRANIPNISSKDEFSVRPEVRDTLLNKSLRAATQRPTDRPSIHSNIPKPRDSAKLRLTGFGGGVMQPFPARVDPVTPPRKTSYQFPLQVNGGRFGGVFVSTDSYRLFVDQDDDRVFIIPASCVQEDKENDIDLIRNTVVSHRTMATEFFLPRSFNVSQCEKL